MAAHRQACRALNGVGCAADDQKSLPVIFNYKLSALATLVPNDRLAEFENMLRASLGERKMSADLGYTGGTISYTDLDGDGWITIATEATDCDYIA